jgi:hypothetical protein
MPISLEGFLEVGSEFLCNFELGRPLHPGGVIPAVGLRGFNLSRNPLSQTMLLGRAGAPSRYLAPKYFGEGSDLPWAGMTFELPEA